ncbi:MAG: arginine--tRNA ligase [Candidatus Micrarchaeota archaeon]
MTGKQSALETAVEESGKALAKAIKEKLFFEFAPKVEIAKEKGLGDLAFACFPLAAKAKKNPNEIAELLAQELNAKPAKHFGKAKAVNGFVNFSFNDDFYAQVLEESTGEKYGENGEGKGKKVIIEFSQPNVGKPFHVGHIRSTILGDAVSNLYQAQGWKVERINYIGDSGSQVAKLILATEIYKDLPAIENEKHMLEYYVRINKEIEENPSLKEKARTVLEKIEEGDEGILERIQFIRKKSYEAFQRNYDLLGIKFDLVIGESEFIKPSKKIVEEALKKGIAFVDKGGETVVKLEQYGLPNFIVLRSNGTTLYSTRDLALADFKKKKFGFDKSVILTASEQNTHFKQFIKTLELLGRDYVSEYKHVGFGFITLAEGKLSTREGRIVFLEDVLNQAVDYARQEIESAGSTESIEEKRRKMSEKEIAKAAGIVGIGSAKFAVLRITPEKNILFDLKKIVSFQGDTGAYVQYTCVRAKSILEKAKGAKPEIKGEAGFNNEEKNVLRLLAEYPLVLKSSRKSMQPHQLCEFTLKLSAAFNEFYHAHSVFKAEGGEKEKRLALVKATAGVLESALSILGVQVPEKM